MLDEKQKLAQIIELGQEINRVNDIDLLLEKILTVARHFVNADAGSIYIREDDRLKFSQTQNETMQKRLPPGQKLMYSVFSILINNASLSGYVANTGAMLNIPDVHRLPPGVPYAFNPDYDTVAQYRSQSMLTFPLKTNKGKVIGVLQLINARNAQGAVIPFPQEAEPFILHFANTAAIAIERALMTRAFILKMIKMSEMRDPVETGAHVNRVAAYAVDIYEAWASRRGVPERTIEKNRDILRMAAMLHDAGKVAIADAILKKTSKLDPAEFEIMQQHTYLGARLFTDPYSEIDEAASLVALTHHERWDGNGYPGHIQLATAQPLPGYALGNGKARGKKAEEIPPFGRVVAIADVYDALCSRRAYKDPWNEDQVLDAMTKEKGRHFDPDMIEAFLSILDAIRSIGRRYPNA